MSEYAETIVNIEVFMRLPFFCFFMFSVSDGRLWDVISEGFEGPVLPSGPAGHAIRQTAEIHGFQAGPGSEGIWSGEGKMLIRGC